MVRRTLTGFWEFIRQYGVLPLAIGVVIGTAVNDLIKSLVDGIISPLIALLTPQTTLSEWRVQIHSSVFQVGMFLDSLIKFLILAFIVYLFVKYVLRQEQPSAK